MLSSYWLDSLAPEGDTAAVELALEAHLIDLMEAQGYTVESVATTIKPLSWHGIDPLPYPEGWVMLRAIIVVEELEVEVELDDDGLDDPAETFDVDVPLAESEVDAFAQWLDDQPDA